MGRARLFTLLLLLLFLLLFTTTTITASLSNTPKNSKDEDLNGARRNHLTKAVHQQGHELDQGTTLTEKQGQEQGQENVQGQEGMQGQGEGQLEGQGQGMNGNVTAKERQNGTSFSTPAMRRHYEMWMKRIRESEYMKNRTRQGRKEQLEQYEEEEEEEMDEEQDEMEDSERKKREVEIKEDEIVGEKKGQRNLEKRSKSVNKVVYRGQKKENETPKPHRIDRSCECGHHNSRRAKIVGGSEAHQHTYPWVVSLQLARGKVHFCGCSIITADYVLTAAHCSEGLFPFELVVRVGDHNLATRDTSRERTIKVTTITEHPRYNIETTDSDISLLKLADKLVFTWRVSPICLTPPDLTFYKEIVTVMGWGRRFEKDEATPTILRHVNLKVLPMNKCRYKFLLESDEVTSKMFCAHGGERDTCQGDSGGPLVWRDKTTDRYFIVGVTSWGVGCGLSNYPGVYTKVSKFLTWIYEETKDSRYCASYTPKPDMKKIKTFKKGKKSGTRGGKSRNEIEGGKWIYKVIGGKNKKKDRKNNTNRRGKALTQDENERNKLETREKGGKVGKGGEGKAKKKRRRRRRKKTKVTHAGGKNGKKTRRVNRVLTKNGEKENEVKEGEEEKLS